MKRIGMPAVLLAAAVVLLLSGAWRPAEAQYRRAERPIGVYLNIGYMNLNSIPKWLTVGPELELRLGRVLSLNPDVSIWFRDSFGGSVHLVPGASANFRLGYFFIGGGAVRRISDWADRADGTFVPKLHGGFATGPVRISAAILFLNRTDTFVFGLNIGLGF